jgi:hypothetical protein
VVAGNRDGDASGGSAGLVEAGQARQDDGVERLDRRVAQMRLDPLAFRLAGVGMATITTSALPVTWVTGSGVAPVRAATSASVAGPRELAMVT